MFYSYAVLARAVSSCRQKNHPTAIRRPCSEELIDRFVSHVQASHELFLDREFRKLFLASLYLDDPEIIPNDQIMMIFKDLKSNNQEERSSYFHFFHFSHSLKENYKMLLAMIAPDEEDIKNTFEFIKSNVSYLRISKVSNLEMFQRSILSMQNGLKNELKKNPTAQNQAIISQYEVLKNKLEDQLVEKIKKPVYVIKETADGIELKKKNPPIRNLSFSGGGAKGAGYFGVMESIEKMGRRHHLKQVCGSSAGSLLASLVCFGLDFLKIKEIYENLQLKKLTDNQKIIERLNFELSSHVMKRYEELIKDPNLNAKERLRINLFKTKYKLDLKPFVLFEDLAILRKYDPTNHPDLLVTGTCEDGKLMIFSMKNSPHMPVAEAVAASCSLPIPLLTGFKPVAFKNQKIRDGGIKDNSPIDYFKSPATRENTLAIFFETHDTASRMQTENDFFIIKKDFSRRIVDTLTGHHTYSNWNSSYYRLKKLGVGVSAVNILYGNVGVLNFDEATKLRAEMANHAKCAVLNACFKRDFDHKYKSYFDLFFNLSSYELKEILKDGIAIENSNLDEHFIKKLVHDVMVIRSEVKAFILEINAGHIRPDELSLASQIEKICRKRGFALSNQSVLDYFYKVVTKHEVVCHYFMHAQSVSEQSNGMMKFLKEKLYHREFKKQKRDLIENHLSPDAFQHSSGTEEGKLTMGYLNYVQGLRFNPENMEESMRILKKIEKEYKIKMQEIKDFKYDFMDLPSM